MKSLIKIALFTLVVSGLQFVIVGCVAEVGGAGYYDRGPWYHDGPWLDGGGWDHGRRGGERVGVDIDIHPPGHRR